MVLLLIIAVPYIVRGIVRNCALTAQSSRCALLDLCMQGLQPMMGGRVVRQMLVTRHDLCMQCVEPMADGRVLIPTHTNRGCE